MCVREVVDKSAKKTVAKTINFFTKNETSVKNGLSLDPKSNEMAENSQNLLSLESVFDIDALFILSLIHISEPTRPY